MKTLLSVLLFSLCASAQASCPSAHLEPMMDFGQAFGKLDLGAVDVTPESQENTNLEQVFQYFEFQTPDAGFDPAYGIYVTRGAGSGEGKVFLARFRKGTPFIENMPLTTRSIDRVKAIAQPIISQTHYPEARCTTHFTDGYTIQVAVASPIAHSGMGFIGGEAFSPSKGSPAERLANIGRALKKYALKQMTLTEFEALIQE